MMHCSIHLLKTRFNMRLINRLYSNANIMKFHSQSIYRNKMYEPPKVMSTKFSDYELIYCFPHIQFSAALNRTKFNLSVLSAVGGLIGLGANLLNYISTNVFLACFSNSILLTAGIHVVCIVCNNLIAFVYLRKEDQSIIISYLDYWGRRVDLKTDVTSILPLSKTPLNTLNMIYRKVNIKPSKKKLKLMILYGQIIKEENYTGIFGV